MWIKGRCVLWASGYKNDHWGPGTCDQRWYHDTSETAPVKTQAAAEIQAPCRQVQARVALAGSVTGANAATSEHSQVASTLLHLWHWASLFEEHLVIESLNHAQPSLKFK